MYLAADGEEAAAGGVHEDEFGEVAVAGAVGVDTEDQLALGVVDGEAIAGEEERGFEDSEVDLFLVCELIFNNNSPTFHFSC